MEETVDKSRDTASRSSSASRSIHQLCVIITEAAEEENNHSGNKEVNMQEREGESTCFGWRMENDHDSCQPRD
jgi:hypothetical protein